MYKSYFIFVQQQISIGLSSIINNFNDLILQIYEIYPPFVELFINVFETLENIEEKRTIIEAILVVSRKCFENPEGEFESNIIETISESELFDIFDDFDDIFDESDEESVKLLNISSEIIKLFRPPED